MKRVKIMLLSLTLLAIVGGALAFKAKYTADFCTTTFYSIDDNRTTCPSLTIESKTTVVAAPTTLYTTTAPNLDCTYLSANGQPQPITCVDTWRTIVHD